MAVSYTHLEGAAQLSGGIQTTGNYPGKARTPKAVSYTHLTAHPYTIGLFESLPSLTGEETRLKPIMGMMPDPSNLPSGCYFHPRCPYADKRCEECKPELLDIGGGHLVRCGKTGLAAGRGTGGL